MKILVTGFEPFGGDPENASIEAVRRLAAAWAADPQAGVELVTGELPVSFAAAGPALTALVEQHAPDAVLAVGEAGGRAAITPERWGVNEDFAWIPDNTGGQPLGSAIDPAGPARRGSGFEVDALVSAVLAVGLPADVSDDAGRFLCNHIAYRVAGLPVPGGFVHVPAVRTRGAATVGAETDADAPARASGITHEGKGLTFDDLGLALAAMVRAIAEGRANRPSTREVGRVDRASTVVAAAAGQVYAALLDPAALEAWLPPEGAVGRIEWAGAHEGGGFTMELRFAAPVDAKTGEDTDVSRVTFAELVPGRRVVQRVVFDSGQERFGGEMTMTWVLEPVEAGTRVTVAATGVPEGVSQADHELGLGSSLAKLARYLGA